MRSLVLLLVALTHSTHGFCPLTPFGARMTAASPTELQLLRKEGRVRTKVRGKRKEVKGFVKEKILGRKKPTADDISIPYDAAARNAFEASDKSVAYQQFKTKFEADAVADVIAKNAPAADISIPYDAAARNAYEASDKSVAYAKFKTQFEADAVAYVIAKNAPAPDLSIPYDAAAKNAYEFTDKSMAYGDFKTKFEAAAVADIIAKKFAKTGKY